MASIRDYAVTINVNDTNPLVCEMPTMVPGDLLVAFIAKDGNGTFSPNPPGWLIPQSGATAGAYGAIVLKRAQSDSDSLSITLGLTDAAVAIVCSIKGVYGTTAEEAVGASFRTAADDLTLPFAGAGLTAAQRGLANYTREIMPGPPMGEAELTGFGTNPEPSATETNTQYNLFRNSLMLHMLHTDAVSAPMTLPPWVNVFGGDSATNSNVVSYSVEPDPTAAITAPNSWAAPTEDDTRAMIIEIRDGTNGQDLPPYLPLDTVPSTQISPFSGSGGNIDVGNWPTALNQWLDRVIGKSTVRLANTATTDSGYNPFRGVTTTAGSSSTIQVATSEFYLTNQIDVKNNGGLIFGTYLNTNPRDYLDTGQSRRGGIFIVLGTNNYMDALVPGPPPGTAELQDFDILSWGYSLDILPGPPPGGGELTDVGDTDISGGMEINTNSRRIVTTNDWVDMERFSTSWRAFRGNLTHNMKRTDSSPYKAYVVGGQFSKTEKADARNNYLIDLASADTASEVLGNPSPGTLDWLAIGSSGYYGAPAMLWNELWVLNEAQLAGGSPQAPFGFDSLITTVNTGCGYLPLMQQAGALATCWIPLKFGGNDRIGIALDLNTIQFPRKADKDDYLDFHVPNDRVGIEFYGRYADDYLSFTNCLFTSASSYYWRFNASHLAAAYTDFSGSTVVKAKVTLQSTVTLDNMNFINCTEFNLNDATLDSCAFTNTKLHADALSELEGVTNTSFDSTGSGHAIEVVGSAASITLTGLTFTDYATVDGSTGNEAIYVNIASGVVTLNITGGGSTPSIRTAGATVVVVVNPVTLSVHVQNINTAAAIVGARVWIPVSSTAGGWPYNASVTITQAAGTATVAHVAHGLTTNDWVWIQGANELEYLGTRQITVTGVDSYTYAIDAGASSPATGTITATFVIINTTTNGTGDCSATYTYDADQTVSGRVRTATGGTYYKTSPVSATIDSATGLSLVVQMIPDS